MPENPSNDIKATIDKLRFAAIDPDGPLYGSDIVPWIDDVTTAYESLVKDRDAAVDDLLEWFGDSSLAPGLLVRLQNLRVARAPKGD